MLFVPSNNALPAEKADVVTAARAADIARAQENQVTIIRADVAGRTAGLVSYGSTGVVDAEGTVRRAATPLTEDLVVVELAANLVSAHRVPV